MSTELEQLYLNSQINLLVEQQKYCLSEGLYATARTLGEVIEEHRENLEILKKEDLKTGLAALAEKE